MYSKCLWKMFNSEERVNRSKRPIEVDDILDSLLDAIDSLPQKKEPILEPHFKFVSVVHKLVKRGLLEVVINPPFLLSVNLLTTSSPRMLARDCLQHGGERT